MNEIKIRQEFLSVYSEFNDWLKSLGFRPSRINEYSNSENHLTIFEKYITSLHGTERYLHDDLKIEIIFQRDRNEHKFMFVDACLCGFSKVYSLEEMKKAILSLVIEERDSILTKMNKLKHIK